jgi:hypothetical protein
VLIVRSTSTSPDHRSRHKAEPRNPYKSQGITFIRMHRHNPHGNLLEITNSSCPRTAFRDADKQSKQKNSPAPYEKSKVPVAEAIPVERRTRSICKEGGSIQCSSSQKRSLKVHRRQGSRSTILPRVSRLPRLSW